MNRGKIKVVNNQVYSVETYVLWNGKLTTTIEIQHKQNGTFTSLIGDPEHGGGLKQGTRNEVLTGLHPNITHQYSSLFQLSHVDQVSIKAAGFEGYKLVVQ